MATQAMCWTVNALGEVWTLYPGGGGNLMSPANQDFAQDICVDPTGIAWIISTQVQQGGNVILGLEPGDNQWVAIYAPVVGVRVAAGLETPVYAIDGEGQVWAIIPSNETNNRTLISPPEEDFAMEVAVGPDGTVWVVSTEIDGGGNLLKSWNPNNQTWSTLPAPANAIKVSVDPKGVLWTVNSSGEVWMVYPEGGGELMSPSGTDFAQDISVGPDGTVWIIGTQAQQGGNIVMWWSGQGQNWNSIPAPAAAIAVAGAVQD